MIYDDESIAEDITPDPAPMLEANRNLGYTFEEAVADLIDNSITARASEVNIDFQWNEGVSFLTIYDNGSGMNLKELINSFKLASKNPLDKRKPEDLGRFGYGMKTASLSQARILTVISRFDSEEVQARTLDLDFVHHHKKWILKFSNISLKEYHFNQSGTIIRWDNWDRAPKDESDFLELYTRLENYLAVVFHRYLEKGRLSIYINDIQINPISPIPDDSQLYSEVKLQNVESNQLAYILKHPSYWDKDFNSCNQFNSFRLFDGLERQQGIYIYRCNRLLTPHGGWLGTVRQNNSSKLARVVINYPNDADHLWSLDITKTNAEIPSIYKKEISNLINKARHQSLTKINKRNKQEIRRIRGIIGNGIIWKEHLDENYLVWRYVPNIDHPVFRNLIDQKQVLEKDLKLIFNLLSENLPIAKIIENNDDDPGRHDRMTCKVELSEFEIRLAKSLFLAYTKLMTREKAFNEIISIEPYCYYQEIVKKFLND